MSGIRLVADFASVEQSYTAPAGDNVAFQELDRQNHYVPPDGTHITFAFVPGETYTAPAGDSVDFMYGYVLVPVDPPLPAGTYVIAGYRAPWSNVPNNVQHDTGSRYEQAVPTDTGTVTQWEEPHLFVHTTYTERIDYSRQYIYNNFDIMSNSLVVPVQAVTGVVMLRYDGLRILYSDWAVHSDYDFSIVQTDYTTLYDVGKHRNTDFEMSWFGLDGFTLIDSTIGLKFEKEFTPIDHSQTIRWGYGLNNFVVGGITTVPSNPEPGLVEDPDGEVIEHINYEVYRAVNIVNITETVSGTNVMFDSFKLQTDIESYAWTATFDVLDKNSFDLIRPIGRSMKTVDIVINGETYTVVISKASLQRRQGNVVYRCSGWSRTKLLADPYAAKRSFKDTSQRTAAQIVDNELTGTGFTYTWSTVDWNIPAGVHSYQNKTPLGAIISVANAVGAVIVPHPTNMSFDVRPYFPNSPWDWDTSGLNRSMNELQFFEISNDPVPQPNPDGVYVYGEDANGVGVKAVRQGLPGTSLLPDVVDKYITANVAGQERGRQEVAKACFMDRHTMTTYVDENGIVKPHELIQFTDTDGGTWRGMVMAVSVDCARVGTALSQTITVGRFYDD